MGVPAFFRWLSRKYPSVITECVENKKIDDKNKNILEDATLPNPNGVEFDNLYLDMNGIIHPCTHPEDKPAPKNEDEMMVAIFECIDRIFGIVRPRKLLYMAIDGVAPRAKMNQQRSRRFRAAKEAVEKQREIKRIREDLLSKGCVIPPEKSKGEHFDSNCITPGTPFMERLSRCLHYYIHDRLNNNPAWRNVKIILSDANVPGEGEHKIMDYIRRQRAQPDHDPNTQHVLCGADADLIMLGLATHEPNFTIIREEFLPNKPRPCEVCGQFGHEMDKCQGLEHANAIIKPDILAGSEVKFVFVRLSVLREYLKRTLAMPNLPFEYDFERVIDDWVFMCFFVGNDFLPHLPSLEIREAAVDRLVELYKRCVYKTGGYLTDSGEVNLDRVQLILTDLGLVEDQIFKERQRREESFKAREKGKRRRMETCPPDFSRIHNSQFAPTPLGRESKGNTVNAIKNPRQEAARFRVSDMQQQQQQRNFHSRSFSDNGTPLESMMHPIDDDKPGKRKKEFFEDISEVKEEEEEEDYQNNDEVRLWEDGFKERYYESKFDVGPDNLNFRYAVALQYVRGLCWVLKYYYQGCASWKWYFPYHYAPFASDFVNISGLSTKFEKKTKPFRPLEQLMGVFPAASSSHVPEPWAKLMSDPDSPIIDFYPEDFKIDLNGKKFAWQGVALLPFVDEKRLFKALKPYYKLLTPEENKRNETGDSRLYVHPSNPGYKFLKRQHKNKIGLDVEVPISMQGMQGIILLATDNVKLDGTLHSPISGLLQVSNNKVICVRYRDPQYLEDFIFPACRLEEAIDPPNILPHENRNFHHRPTIGFTKNIPQASLGSAGHRMLGHYVDQPSTSQQRSYAAIPPHPSLTKNSNDWRSNNSSVNSYRGRNNYQQPHNNFNNFRRSDNNNWRSFNNFSNNEGTNNFRNQTHGTNSNNGYSTFQNNSNQQSNSFRNNGRRPNTGPSNTAPPQGGNSYNLWQQGRNDNGGQNSNNNGVWRGPRPNRGGANNNRSYRN